MEYKVSVAKQIIEMVRRGLTVRQICKGEDMPDILDVYDWRDNPKCKVNKETFGTAMAKAERDRHLTWQDEIVEIYDYVPNTGTRQDHTELKRADAKASLLLRLMKDERDLQRVNTRTVGENVNVTIKKFATPISPADRTAELDKT